MDLHYLRWNNPQGFQHWVGVVVYGYPGGHWDCRCDSGGDVPRTLSGYSFECHGTRTGR